MTESRRRSLHLGVDVPDPTHYGGSVPELTGAKNDARRWRKFFASRGGWDSTCWVGEDATTGNLARWVSDAATAALDWVVITWSGHGAQLAADSGLVLLPHRESDYDELWVMHDRLLFDDEVFGLLTAFEPPTRVIVVADCCHSGTSFKVQPTEEDEWADTTHQVPRAVGDPLANQILTTHQQAYREILEKLDPAAQCRADFVGLAACRDSERAYESAGQGAFTRALLDLLEKGYTGTYAELVEAAKARTPYQNPRPFWYDMATLLHTPAFRA